MCSAASCLYCAASLKQARSGHWKIITLMRQLCAVEMRCGWFLTPCRNKDRIHPEWPTFSERLAQGRQVSRWCTPFPWLHWTMANEKHEGPLSADTAPSPLLSSACSGALPGENLGLDCACTHTQTLHTGKRNTSWDHILDLPKESWEKGNQRCTVKKTEITQGWGQSLQLGRWRLSSDGAGRKDSAHPIGLFQGNPQWYPNHPSSVSAKPLQITWQTNFQPPVSRSPAQLGCLTPSVHECGRAGGLHRHQYTSARTN